MVPPGRKSEGSAHIERWLHSPIHTQTSTGERPINNQWLCKPPQESLPEGGFACTDPLKGSRDGKGSNLSSLFQQVIHCPQTKQEMAANLRPQCSHQIVERKNIQNGNTRNHPDLPPTRGMGDLAGFQRRLFPHSYSSKISKIPQISLSKPDFSGPGPAFWPLHSSYGVHLRGQRGKIDGSSLGYKNPPVPRRLVDSSPHQRILPPGDPAPPSPLPGVGLGGEPTKIGIGTQTGF